MQDKAKLAICLLTDQRSQHSGFQAFAVDFKVGARRSL